MKPAVFGLQDSLVPQKFMGMKSLLENSWSERIRSVTHPEADFEALLELIPGFIVSPSSDSLLREFLVFSDGGSKLTMFSYRRSIKRCWPATIMTDGQNNNGNEKLNTPLLVIHAAESVNDGRNH